MESKSLSLSLSLSVSLVGDITQKGYEKKRSKLIGAFFPQAPGKTDFPSPFISEQHLENIFYIFHTTWNCSKTIMIMHHWQVFPYWDEKSFFVKEIVKKSRTKANRKYEKVTNKQHANNKQS